MPPPFWLGLPPSLKSRHIANVLGQQVLSNREILRRNLPIVTPTPALPPTEPEPTEVKVLRCTNPDEDMPGWEPISTAEYAAHAIYSTASYPAPAPTTPLSSTEDSDEDSCATQEDRRPDIPLIITTDWDLENDNVDRSHPEDSVDAVMCASFGECYLLPPRGRSRRRLEPVSGRVSVASQAIPREPAASRVSPTGPAPPSMPPLQHSSVDTDVTSAQWLQETTLLLSRVEAGE